MLGCSRLHNTKNVREIFSLKELSNNRVAAYQMDILISERNGRLVSDESSSGSSSSSSRHNNRRPLTDVVPLFKLVRGTSMGSFGFACALASGIHVDVIHRAQTVANAIEHGDQITPIIDNAAVREQVCDRHARRQIDGPHVLCACLTRVWMLGGCCVRVRVRVR